MKFLRNKKLISDATEGPFKNIFIAEELTLLRYRLVWHIKSKFGHKFCKVLYDEWHNKNEDCWRSY